MTQWRGAQPIKTDDDRPRCAVPTHRTTKEGLRRLLPCGRLAKLYEIRAYFFHFRIEMFLCGRHQTLIAHKYSVAVNLIDHRKLESEVA